MGHGSSMTGLNVTIRQMRTLIAIDEQGTIVGASGVLGLTAPALTLQLRQLEDEAGTPLFDRTPRGMRATTAGKVFIAAARDIEARLATLESEVDAITGVRRGALAVGVVSTAEYFARPLIAAFMREFPDLTVELIAGKRADTVARLKAYEVDVMLTARPPRGLPARAKAFATYELIAVASPGNPILGQGNVAKESLASEHLIVRERGSGPRVSLDRFLGGDLDKLAIPYTEMDSNAAVTEAVVEDLGIAIVAGHTVADQLASGHLAMVDVEGLPIEQRWFSVTRSDKAMTPALARFQQFLVEHGPEYIRLHDGRHPHD